MAIIRLDEGRALAALKGGRPPVRAVAIPMPRPGDEEEIRRQIALLSDPDANRREAATRRLVEINETTLLAADRAPIIEALRASLAATTDPEVTERLRFVLAQTPEEALRRLQVLGRLQGDLEFRANQAIEDAKRRVRDEILRAGLVRVDDPEAFTVEELIHRLPDAESNLWWDRLSLAQSRALLNIGAESKLINDEVRAQTRWEYFDRARRVWVEVPGVLGRWVNRLAEQAIPRMTGLTRRVAESILLPVLNYLMAKLVFAFEVMAEAGRTARELRLHAPRSQEVLDRALREDSARIEEQRRTDAQRRLGVFNLLSGWLSEWAAGGTPDVPAEIINDDAVWKFVLGLVFYPPGD